MRHPLSNTKQNTGMLTTKKKEKKRKESEYQQYIIHMELQKILVYYQFLKKKIHHKKHLHFLLDLLRAQLTLIYKNTFVACS